MYYNNKCKAKEHTPPRRNEGSKEENMKLTDGQNLIVMSNPRRIAAQKELDSRGAFALYQDLSLYPAGTGVQAFPGIRPGAYQECDLPAAQQAGDVL